jgi:hypothetical protein
MFFPNISIRHHLFCIECYTSICMYGVLGNFLPLLVCDLV